LLNDADCPEHDATPVGPLLFVLQVVEVKLLPEFAAESVQLATAVGPDVLYVQFVAVQPLPELAADGVHDATSVGAVDELPQVILV
jgi:hypothetical protein